MGDIEPNDDSCRPKSSFEDIKSSLPETIFHIDSLNFTQEMILGQLCCAHPFKSKKHDVTKSSLESLNFQPKIIPKPGLSDSSKENQSPEAFDSDMDLHINKVFSPNDVEASLELKTDQHYRPMLDSKGSNVHNIINDNNSMNKFIFHENAKFLSKDHEQNIFPKTDTNVAANKSDVGDNFETQSCFPSLDSSKETLHNSNTLMCSVMDVVLDIKNRPLNMDSLHISEPNIATQQFLGVEESIVQYKVGSNCTNRSQSLCWDTIKPLENIFPNSQLKTVHSPEINRRNMNERSLKKNPLMKNRSKNIETHCNRFSKRGHNLDDCNAVMASSFPPRCRLSMDHFNTYSNKENLGRKNLKRFSMCHSYHSSPVQPSSPTFLDPNNEPIHMTLEEVKHQIEQMQKASGISPSHVDQFPKVSRTCHGSPCKLKQTTDVIRVKERRLSFKDTVCSFFGIRKSTIDDKTKDSLKDTSSLYKNDPLSCKDMELNECPSPYINRALPPIPPSEDCSSPDSNTSINFFASLQKVKDCGWYWGPISGSMAEAILADKQDGSFLVRDSSDDYYIFSVTFKLNKRVHHVRIEHNQGNFSFGSLETFKFNTIIEFIEKAVEHSHSGGYLFFLRSRPGLAPTQVQLLFPVSRFKMVLSLQHLCRFVILKTTRRDHINSLPLPQRLLIYLNQKQYYAEDLVE